MVTGIGVYIVGLVIVLTLGFLLGLATDWELGLALVILLPALIGVYFIGEIISKELNLI